MESKANISISNVDDTEKEVVTLSYFVKECGTVESARELKEKFDKIIEKEGGESTQTNNSRE